MHGLSPINHSLTLLQRQTSAQISDTLQDFPTTVSDLISQMAVPDYSLALQPLELNKAGEIVKNEKNQEIVAMIELVLTSSSSECDPKIKAAVLMNATVQNLPLRPALQPHMATIIRGLQYKKQQIILDDVVIKDLDMSTAVPIDFSGMSAKRATFDNVNMNHLKMDHADFTGAHFFGTSLEAAQLNNANCVDARFTNVSFRNTQACELTGNQSVLFKSCSSKLELTITDDQQMVRRSSSLLSGRNLVAIPDSENFTLPAQKIVETID